MAAFPAPDVVEVVIDCTCGDSTAVTVTVMLAYAEPSAALAAVTWLLSNAGVKAFAAVVAAADFVAETVATKVTRALRRAAEEETEQPVAYPHVPPVCS